MKDGSEIPLPGDWPDCVHGTFRRIAMMTHMAVIQTRSWCANSNMSRVHMAGVKNRAVCRAQVSEEVSRLNKSRMLRVPAAHRPHYTPEERLQILELRASQGWTAAETASKFCVTAATISHWERQVDNPKSKLFSTKVPVNTYDQLTRALVRRVKRYCPTMGKMRIAQLLALAGLHVSSNTVQRMITEGDHHEPESDPVKNIEEEPVRRIVAPRPEHTLHVDLTVVPIGGLWRPENPYSFPVVYPFCWWVFAVVDHYSRACLAYAVFKKAPSSQEVCRVLQGVVDQCKGTVKYVISDQGTQFAKPRNGMSKGAGGQPNEEYQRFCSRNGIQPRFGAVGRHGSIAVIERFFLSLKNECTRQLVFIPYRMETLQEELSAYVYWYNACRPHRTLNGCTPLEAHWKLPPKNEAPRIEPRAR